MPDDTVVLTEGEWLILEHEPSHLLKLYLAMRWQANRKTGVVGPLASLFFRRALYISPRPGRSRSEYPTPGLVRSTLAALERLNLVRPRPDLGRGMFTLPQAGADAGHTTARVTAGTDYRNPMLH
ncbi:MAG: hypothetical protein U1F76_29105 [Candidatus Competibacteraceae bacterium]